MKDQVPATNGKKAATIAIYTKALVKVPKKIIDAFHSLINARAKEMFIIQDESARVLALATAMECKAIALTIQEIFNPRIDSASFNLKALRAERNLFLDPLVEIQKNVNAGLLRYQEAEQAAALEKAKERNAQEAQTLKTLAVKMSINGDDHAAAQLLETAKITEETQAAVAPVKIEGMTTAKLWDYEITSEQLLKLAICAKIINGELSVETIDINKGWLRHAVTSLKTNCIFPGLKVFQKPSIRTQ